MPGLLDKKATPYPGLGAFDYAAFTIGTEAANAITVNVQLQTARRRDIAQRGRVDWYLSDDANGDSQVATAVDGGVAAGTDGLCVSTVTGKSGWAVSESDGDLDFVITHAAGAKTVYLILVYPDGSLRASNAITFA